MVLQIDTRCYRLSQGMQDATGCCKVLQDVTGYCKALQVIARDYKLMQDDTAYGKELQVDVSC